MAKKAQPMTQHEEIADTLTVADNATRLGELTKSEFPRDLTIDLWDKSKFNLLDLPLHAIQTLAQHGAAKQFSDATGGLKKQMESEVERNEAGEPILGEDGKPIRAHSDAEISEKLSSMKAERWEAILANKLTTRGAPRLATFESIVRDVAEEFIVAKATQLGKDVPKGKELTATRDKALGNEKFRAMCESEAKARQDRAKAMDFEVEF